MVNAGSIAKTRKELASEYGISSKTLTKWLKNAGVKLEKGLITPKDQMGIYDRFGVPKVSHYSPYWDNFPKI